MGMTRRKVRIALVGAAVLILAAPAAAQMYIGFKTPGIPRLADGSPDLNAPAPMTIDGKPDISGLWRVNGYQYSLTKDLNPGDVAWLPQGKELFDSRRDNNSLDNPWGYCYPGGTPRAYLSPDPFKIVHTPNLTVILFEAVQSYRQIFTDGRILPNPPDPTWMGYSTGRWEGDVFVVETVGFRDDVWLDSAGMPGSSSLRVTERFHRESFGTLTVAITIDDPENYAEPWTVTLPLTPYPDDELVEYVCVDNNTYLENASKLSGE